MKMHHFFIKEKLKIGEMTIADLELAHQLKDVLKFSPNEKIILSDGQGEKAEVAIVQLNKKDFSVEVKNIEKTIGPEKNLTTLYCAILKRDHFEWAVQKAVECGVQKIVPIVSERTIKNKINLARLEKIIKEAAEQAERSICPVLSPAMMLEETLADSQHHDTNIWFDPSGGILTKSISEKNKKIGVYVGPEGGWTEVENNWAKNNNFKIISLGKNILRGETAVAVGIYLAGFVI